MRTVDTENERYKVIDQNQLLCRCTILQTMFRPENDPGNVARSLWLRTTPECHRTLRTLNGQPRPGVEEGRCLKGRCSRYEGEEQQAYPHLARPKMLIYFADPAVRFDRRFFRESLHPTKKDSDHVVPGSVPGGSRLASLCLTVQLQLRGSFIVTDCTERQATTEYQ